MQLWHPGVARIDCRECCKRLYDLETGEVKTQDIGTDARPELVPVDDLESNPKFKPPCQTGTECYRENPEVGPTKDHNELSRAIFMLYMQQRATSGVCLSKGQRRDPFLNYCFALIDQQVRRYERDIASQRLTVDLGNIFLATTFAGREKS